MDQTSPFAQLLFTLLKAALLVVVIVGLSIWGIRYLGGIPLSVSQTTTQKQSTFNVTGETEVTAIPNKAQVSLGVTVQGSTVAQVQDDLNSKINSISQQLKQSGIETKDIKTQNYNISPTYDYSGETQRITGYTASTSLVVSVTDFDKLNEVIDQATALGANQVGGISFGLTAEKQEELNNQAREEAIADAKQKAADLARLSGLKLGKIVDVMESPNIQTPVPMYAANQLKLDSAAGRTATSVEPGSNTYTYTVTLSYETL